MNSELKIYNIEKYLQKVYTEKWKTSAIQSKISLNF